MKITTAALLIGPLMAPVLAASPAMAALAPVPHPIVALLGPTIGYLMSQSDLCGWNLTDKMTSIYTADFKTIGMTPAQQAEVWKVAKFRRAALNNLSAGAKAHMKAETCTAASHARVEAALGTGN